MLYNHQYEGTSFNGRILILFCRYCIECESYLKEFLYFCIWIAKTLSKDI